MCIPHFPSPFICWWTFRLLLNPGHCEQSCSEHGSAEASLWSPDFILFGYVFRGGVAGSCGSCTFKFLRNFHTIFHSGRTILHSLQHCTKVPFSLSSPTSLIFFWIFDVLIRIFKEKNNKICDGEGFFLTFFDAIKTSLKIKKCFPCFYP